MINTDLLRAAADLYDDLDDEYDGNRWAMAQELALMLPYSPARLVLDWLEF